MVAPGRLCEVDHSAGFGASEELGAEAQRAAAAGGLNRRASRFEPLREGSENQVADSVEEAPDSHRGQVHFGRLGREEIPFRVRDRLHERGGPFVIAVNPHRQVDLVRGGVAGEGFHQSEDRIRRHRFEAGKGQGLSTLTAALAPFGRFHVVPIFVDVFAAPHRSTQSVIPHNLDQPCPAPGFLYSRSGSDRWKPLYSRIPVSGEGTRTKPDATSGIPSASGTPRVSSHPQVHCAGLHASITEDTIDARVARTVAERHPCGTREQTRDTPQQRRQRL